MAETTVLVTRPAAQSRELGEQLREAGYRPVYAPLLEIRPIDEPGTAQRQVLMDLCHFDHVIFVSRNAIRYGMEWIEDFWPQLPTGINWYTVGSGSAAVLESFGVLVQQPSGPMTSEGLLAMPGLTKVRGQRILIVKGEGGRQHLADTLAQRGARVEELAVYRRACPAYPEGGLARLIQDEAVDFILVSSGEGLDNMVSLLGREVLESVRSRPLVVPGERVANLARGAGFSEVIEAENATDQAMLAALLAERERGALAEHGDKGER
jgi:uroporphyrinogen-III synthase